MLLRAEAAALYVSELCRLERSMLKGPSKMSDEAAVTRTSKLTYVCHDAKLLQDHFSPGIGERHSSTNTAGSVPARPAATAATCPCQNEALAVHKECMKYSPQAESEADQNAYKESCTLYSTTPAREAPEATS